MVSAGRNQGALPQGGGIEVAHVQVKWLVSGWVREVDGGHSLEVDLVFEDQQTAIGQARIQRADRAGQHEILDAQGREDLDQEGHLGGRIAFIEVDASGCE
jgi:hypothetical protein